MATAIRLGCLLLPCIAIAASAEPADPAQTDIRMTLTRWMDNFNARQAGPICDLFAPELRYDYRGFPERGYAVICSLLHRSLADPDRRYHYALDIKEILVEGDLAVVRLVWTLQMSGKDLPAPVTSDDIGMDVFRRQPDGGWKIIRYIAYEAS
ncbi:MAG: nuclear transport factor 2 family protein [Acetobacteraceae bacterium]